jgi:L-arabinose isomerase
VARAVWRPRPDLPTSTQAWLTAGGPHHTVFTSAVTTETLSDLAEMLGVELVVIDANTNVGQFSKELRWNQAYFRLAQGL